MSWWDKLLGRPTPEQIERDVAAFMQRVDERRATRLQSGSPPAFKVQISRQTVKGEELKQMYPLPRNVRTDQKSPNSHAN